MELHKIIEVDFDDIEGRRRFRYFCTFADGLRIKITREQFDRLNNQTSPEVLATMGEELRGLVSGPVHGEQAS